jgi:hypothetical protein
MVLRPCQPPWLHLVADYEHESATGVARAVQQHAEKTGTAYAVIPDLSGTAVFAVESG